MNSYGRTSHPSPANHLRIIITKKLKKKTCALTRGDVNYAELVRKRIILERIIRKGMMMKTTDKTESGDRGHANNLAQRLRKWTHVQRRFGRAYREIFATFEWPHSRATLEVLLYLYRVKKQSEPSVIADFLYTPRQTMTSLLDKMEESGFVVSKPHPTDRRRKLIALTPEGNKVISKLLSDFRATERKAVARVSEERFDEMLSVLDEVCSSIEDLVKSRVETKRE